MKTMLIVFSLIGVTSVLDGATAADDPPFVASDYRAAASDADATASVAAGRPDGPDCGLDRLSVIWGPDRQPGAYECLGRMKF